jgi:hypothetical protein
VRGGFIIIMVKYNGKNYPVLYKFDIYNLKIGTKDKILSTGFVISPLSYRILYNTKASVKVKQNLMYTDFEIIDDHGISKVISIHNFLKNNITDAIRVAKKEGLLDE